MRDRSRVVDITAWAVVHPETIGRNPKVWVREPGGGDDRQRDWLFKPVVVPSGTGHRQGEDWAEKLVSELAGLIGVPCAEVELAVRGEQFGSISRNVVPGGWSMVLGANLLETVVADYRSTIADEVGRERPVRGRPGHNLQNIFAALSSCAPPPDAVAESAAEAFASYLVLDAWVANQDRHDQNWAVLSRGIGPDELQLAPSFDHASSLGFNLTDDRRLVYLRPNEILTFARRGRANRFEHDPDAASADIASLVSFALAALDLVGGTIKRRLMDRLRSVGRPQVENIVTHVPGLSDPTATFIVELLETNRRRLLNEC